MQLPAEVQCPSAAWIW